MPNAASLSAPSATAPPPPPVRSREASAFSFDEAVASAERQAARALDVHGGAPTQTVTSARAQPDGALQADARDKGSPRGAVTPDRAAPATKGAAAAPVSKADNHASIETLPAAAPLSVAIAPAAASPVPLQSSSGTPGPLREALARAKAEAPRATIPLRAPLATKQFAEILAQRLENASQFDLRLDPPSFGSIDGRLTLSDDGQAILSLSFDNQHAFDHFSRDEAALRAALADGGFDLTQQNLQFSFRAPDQAPGIEPPPAHAPEAALSPTSRHRGTIDIRA
ncbi:MAG: flagellar hook-length control protein FliK [Parvularculaceae bacterium]|nr:flagellar hook-length control protein FliK [Parvularculaceae bacterium]